MNGNEKTELTMLTIFFMVSLVVVGICLSQLDIKTKAVEKALNIHLQRGQ